MCICHVNMDWSALRRACATLTYLLVVVFCATGCGMRGSRDRRPEDYFSDSRAVALIRAIDHGNLQEIDRLLSEGVDVNTAGKNMTFLYWAMTSRQKAAFAHLLERGANPNQRVSRFNSIMEIAAKCH